MCIRGRVDVSVGIHLVCVIYREKVASSLQRDKEALNKENEKEYYDFKINPSRSI